MLPSPTEIGAGFRFDIPPLSEKKRKIKATLLRFVTGSLRVQRVKNTIRDGGSTVLYTAYTVDTV